MKKLFVSFLFVFVSIISLSQTYEFDVKNYNLYIVNGFSEKAEILENSKSSILMVCNRKYIIDLDSNLLSFYENDTFMEKFKITDVIESETETEIIVESYIANTFNITTFAIYYTLANDDKLSNICLFWYDPFGDRTFVKQVK